MKHDAEVPARKKPSKNANLAAYRQETAERNEALVRSAVEYILDMEGEPTFSMVSRVTHDLALRDGIGKGLSAAGLSKNPIYRDIILKAKANDGGKRVRASVMAEGDARMALHSLRIENARLKRENSILSDRLATRSPPVEVASPHPEKLIEDSSTMRRTSRALIERLMEEEVALIDQKTGNLILVGFNTVLAQKEALALILNTEKEIL